jgi:hypothetical protein
MSNAFVPFAILLGGEVEVGADGRAEGGDIKNRSAIEGRCAFYFEGSVIEAEWMAVGATVGVFTGMEAGAEEVVLEVADE